MNTGPKNNAFSRGGRPLGRKRVAFKRSKGKQGRRINLSKIGTKRAVRSTK